MIAAAFSRTPCEFDTKTTMIFFLAGFFIVGMARAEDVDLLLTNGNVYTVTEKQPKAEAVAVKANRIVFVGSNEDAKKISWLRRLSIFTVARSCPASLIRTATFSGSASAKCD